MRKFIKIIINIIHKLLVYFMFFGVLLPEKYLLYFVITWPFIYIHWQLNNNRCILTELEYYLDNKPYPPTIDKDHDYPFMKSVLGDFGISMDDENIHYGVMYGLTILWIIGMIRYFKLYKKFM
jgi:hypothetical protein